MVKLEETAPQSLYYGLGGTNSQLDEAYRKFCQVKRLTVELAEVESSVYRLAQAIQKTQKQGQRPEQHHDSSVQFQHQVHHRSAGRKGTRGFLPPQSNQIFFLADSTVSGVRYVNRYAPDFPQRNTASCLWRTRPLAGGRYGNRYAPDFSQQRTLTAFGVLCWFFAGFQGVETTPPFFPAKTAIQFVESEEKSTISV